MKRLAAIALVASAGWAGIAAGNAAAQTAGAGEEQLLAPIYPGSVRYPRDELGIGFAYTAAFLSKDDLATVKAFYERELGPFQDGPLDEGTYSADQRAPGYVYSRVIVPTAEVLKYISYGELGTPDAGMVIAAVEPKQVDDPSSYPVVGPIFEKLQEIIQLQSAGQTAGFEVAKGHDAAELEQVIERYKDLAWRHYLPSDEEKPWTGNRPTIAEAIVERCEKENKPDKEALATRIQQLVMQGKAEEAQKLAMSMVEGGGESGSWDVWVECLQEIEKNAYRTWIAIDEHPSVWKAREDAWEAAQEQE
jgi:hypothetical protein